MGHGQEGQDSKAGDWLPMLRIWVWVRSSHVLGRAGS